MLKPPPQSVGMLKPTPTDTGRVELLAGGDKWIGNTTGQGGALLGPLTLISLIHSSICSSVIHSLQPAGVLLIRPASHQFRGNRSKGEEGNQEGVGAIRRHGRDGREVVRMAWPRRDEPRVQAVTELSVKAGEAGGRVAWLLQTPLAQMLCFKQWSWH